MQLWRINLKPDGEQGVNVTAFCIERGVVGIGWAIDRQPSSKEDYWNRGKELYGKYGRSWSAAANALLYRMQVDDLVWARDPYGTYYVGRISGEWEHRQDADFVKADLGNIRPCEWLRVGSMDNVPGAVVNGFRARATVQLVTDSNANLYSRFLVARFRGERFEGPKDAADSDVLHLLSAEDLEDVVAVYLQVKHGYVMLPSTCKNDTMAVECLLVCRATGARIGLQVKSGQVCVSRDDYREFDGLMYLFAASGAYEGTESSRCECLSPGLIRHFVHEHRTLMPGRVQRWIDFTEQGLRSGAATCAGAPDLPPGDVRPNLA